MAIKLTPAKLAELRQKAEAAEKESPSPWHGVPDGSHCVLVDSEQGVIHTTCDRQRNTADFIAHADPAAVLALVYEIDLLKKRLSWFPAHIKEKIDLAILAHTGGMADPCKEHCGCDDTVGYYCEYCAVYDALISCKQATESEAGQ